ncbi:uncharacterized protein (TIGR01732 family) [Natronobacillus azotifigens]|uniref:YjcZ family sporulation protein n=1 Tax=Natronobacillus azotifigens TaxID=472978 RepID=UPI0023432035|nr:YjcZ family sporulation protein [Natronobacillus azotifigens]
MAYGGFGGGSYAAAQAQAFSDPGFGGCYTAPCGPVRGFGGGFALIVVLFILLIIVGATVVY